MAAKINPTVAMFTASPQHPTLSVTSYALEVYRAADNVLSRTTDLGKPAPNAANDITVPLVKTGLTNNIEYAFHVVTNGPAGSTRSVTPSNPFVFEDAPSPASNLRAQ